MRAAVERPCPLASVLLVLRINAIGAPSQWGVLLEPCWALNRRTIAAFLLLTASGVAGFGFCRRQSSGLTIGLAGDGWGISAGLQCIDRADSRHGAAARLLIGDERRPVLWDRWDGHAASASHLLQAQPRPFWLAHTYWAAVAGVALLLSLERP